MLQLNNGNGTFSQIAYHSGIAETEWSWAPLIADYNNDGWKDIYIANGLKKDMTDWDYKVFVLDSIINTMNKGQSVDLNKWLSGIPEVRVKNYLYRNTGSLKFENATEQWMEEPPSFSSGAAYADLDNDGDLDLIVNNVDDEAFIFKNNSEQDLISNYFKRCNFSIINYLFKNKPDILIIHGWGYPTSLIAIITAKILGIKIWLRAETPYIHEIKNRKVKKIFKYFCYRCYFATQLQPIQLHQYRYKRRI